MKPVLDVPVFENVNSKTNSYETLVLAITEVIFEKVIFEYNRGRIHKLSKINKLKMTPIAKQIH